MSRFIQFESAERPANRRPGAWLAAALLCGTVLLSACGGGGGDSDSSKPTDGPATQAPSSGSSGTGTGTGTVTNSGNSTTTSTGGTTGTGTPSTGSSTGGGTSGNTNTGTGTTGTTGTTGSTGSTGTGTTGGTGAGTGTSTGTSPGAGTTGGTGTGTGAGTGTGTGTTGTTGTGTGGTTDTDTTTPPLPPSNTVDIAVKQGIGNNINVPMVSVTVCAPGATSASQCATIDNLVVDTASYGVRVVASALGNSLVQSLPAQTGASSDATGTTPIAECTLFGSGYTFGSIKRVDLTIGAMKASNLPIQVISDGAFSVPSDCSSRGGVSLNTVAALGANGVLGIGPQAQDYPTAAASVVPATYYACASSTSCASASVPLAKQVTNPVSAFPTDNNGTILQLPAVPAAGAAGLTGTLVFGVGTRANNALPSPANIIPLSSVGRMTTTYNGTRYSGSYIDSGSNGLFFPDTTIPSAAGSWFTPSSPLSLSAVMSSTGSNVVNVPFVIADPTAAFVSGNRAIANIGAYTYNAFAWGLPFFFGRNVYTVIGNALVGSITGPFIAF